MKRSALLIALLCAACSEAPPAPVYQAVPVERRDIVVSAQAAGTIEPEVTVEVKSKASGQILDIEVETGQVVPQGTLMVRVDPRQPRNVLAQARAELEVAEARVKIAESQRARSEKLYKSQSIAETAYEQTQLEYANARADVVRARVAVENAQIQMDDTNVTAPIEGTILEKSVEAGQVISSPTQDVSGGTVLLRMADLTTVQVRTLVDEIDIGKIRPGMHTRVTVAAYPNQPFEGVVLKIEPQAIVDQNVTRFAVLIRLENRGDLLKPGMNAEVEIQIASKDAATMVPTMALRVADDIPATAAMLGLPEAELRSWLGPLGGGAVWGSDTAGRADIGALIEKRRSGASLSAEEVTLLADARARYQQTADRADTSAAGSYEFGGSFWVVAIRHGQLEPAAVRTGLTDLEYSEIVSGLEPTDRVLLLPSASLFEQQAFLQQRIQERFGSGSPFQQSTGGRRF